MTAIYALLDPRTNEVRYVGKAKDPKLRYASHKCVRGYSHRANWIRSLQRCGYDPEMVILEESEDWAESESFWIDYLMSLGARLTNLSKGGESGPVGWSPTEDQRNKMSAKAKARIEEARKFPLLYRSLHAFINRNPAPPTDEQRKVAGERMRRMWADPDVKAKMSAEISDRHKRGLYAHIPHRCMTPEEVALSSENKRKRSGWGKLGLKGVAMVFANKRGEARFSSHAMIPRRTYLGCFKTPEEAGIAYDKAMFGYWGQGTYLNFPDKLFGGNDV